MDASVKRNEVCPSPPSRRIQRVRSCVATDQFRAWKGASVLSVRLLLLVFGFAVVGTLAGTRAPIIAHEKDCSVDRAQVSYDPTLIGDATTTRRHGFQAGLSQQARAARAFSFAVARGYVFRLDLFAIAVAERQVRQSESDEVASIQEQQCKDEHAELHARPRVELLGTTVRDCGYNDCMVFRLRNNWHLRVTDVEIRVYPRDRWGSPVTRCGYYGGTWTWWRVNGQPDGQTFTLQNDEACFRGLGPATSGRLVRVQFSDGSRWSP